ncbi:MAG: hypothetical protein AB7Q23_06765 [Hyphomonadaceae bacterium]
MSGDKLTVIGKAARNEQIKLRAGTFNAIGLAFGAFGVIQPIVVGTLTLESALKVAICALIAYILHRHAARLLAALED